MAKAMKKKWNDLDEKEKLKFISSEDLSRTEIFYKSVGLKPLNSNDMTSTIQHVFFGIFEALMYSIRNEFVSQSLKILEGWERNQWKKPITLAKDISFPLLRGGSLKKTLESKKSEIKDKIPTEIDKMEYNKDLMKTEGGIIEIASVKIGFEDLFDEAIQSLASLEYKEQCSLSDFKIQKFINDNKLQKKQINFLKTDDPMDVSNYHLDCFIFSKNHILELLQDAKNPLSMTSLWKSIPKKVFENLKSLKLVTSDDSSYFNSEEFLFDFNKRVNFPTPTTGPQVTNLIHWMVQNLLLQILGLSNRMGLQFANRTKKRKVSDINSNKEMTLEDGRQIPNTITVGTVLAITETSLRTRMKKHYDIILKESQDLIFLPINILSKKIPFFEKGRIKSQFEDLKENDFLNSIPEGASKQIINKYKELVNALPFFINQNLIFDLKILKTFKNEIKKNDFTSPKYNELRKDKQSWKLNFNGPYPLESKSKSKYWSWGFYNLNSNLNIKSFKRPIVFLLSLDDSNINNTWYAASEISKYLSLLIANFK